MIGAEKIEGISPLFSQGQGRPENIEKAPAGSVLSVPFGGWCEFLLLCGMRNNQGRSRP